ncbi:uncharacterized protein BJ171DRAFT_98740 [Polychytrium aggregatum]|uniref:uncharacterized protein n=1 Tax=Polychytrium aggregatum TaxID=110093 RepID=UPI0022FEFBF8|nr:uncharacterized protein BJ171DRAFT_98740 [Polychytrium aggregatum]KAI9204620.1 hypothetical protein BJ171DRAFT_98740 [Polychytrium aggregatum]
MVLLGLGPRIRACPRRSRRPSHPRSQFPRSSRRGLPRGSASLSPQTPCCSLPWMPILIQSGSASGTAVQLLPSRCPRSTALSTNPPPLASQTDPLEYGYCPGQSSQSPGSSPSSGSTTPSPSPRPAHTAPFGLSAPSLSSSYEDYRFRFPEIKPEGKSFDPSTSDSEGEEAAFEFRAPNPGSAHSRSARPKPSLGHPHSRSASHTGKKHHPHPYQTPKVSSSCTEESAPSDTNLSVSPPKHPSLSSSPRFLGVPSSSPASMSPTLSQSSLSSASSQRRSRKMRTSKSSSSSLDEGSRRKGADSSPPKPAQAQRHCHYCMATQTPMWRHGPPEYPDLCNRCGVKYMRGRLISKKES